MGFPKFSNNDDDNKEILETAYESLNSLQNFINVLTHQHSHLHSDRTNTIAPNFKNLPSLLN
jgi:archaellum component FlaC